MKKNMSTKLLGIAFCTLRLMTSEPCLAIGDEGEESVVGHTPKINLEVNETDDEGTYTEKSISYVKKKAKEAAMKEAWKAAQEMAQNENEAVFLYYAAMNERKLKFETPQERRAISLMRNITLQRANEAAYETAFSHLQNEEDTLNLVNSLKIGSSLKEVNLHGASPVVSCRPKGRVQAALAPCLPFPDVLYTV